MSFSEMKPGQADVVLGGQTIEASSSSAVLGGFEGVKNRILQGSDEQKIAALSEALKYGEEGLNFVIQLLDENSFNLNQPIYELLKYNKNYKVQKRLNNYLPKYEFDVVNVNSQGVITSQKKGSARYFVESLGSGVELEMVAIPGGEFVMGSPETELYREQCESPQHLVTVQPYFMGKYPITQAQWRVVAGFPKVKRELNSEPSQCKGQERPVECVSWFDAEEFCMRLTRVTGRRYQLPSEAEWENACRAGTTTPFYFGETISSELANYDGNFTYAGSPKGEYRIKTTPVGQFPPNAYGLYDMHGNVLEWCQDHWHSNYEGAPNNASAWLTNNDNASRVLRGGSWRIFSMWCRSAYRCDTTPDNRNNNFGFRVVCDSPRTS